MDRERGGGRERYKLRFMEQVQKVFEVAREREGERTKRRVRNE